MSMRSNRLLWVGTCCGLVQKTRPRQGKKPDTHLVVFIQPIPPGRLPFRSSQLLHCALDQLDVTPWASCPLPTSWASILGTLPVDLVPMLQLNTTNCKVTM